MLVELRLMIVNYMLVLKFGEMMKQNKEAISVIDEIHEEAILHNKRGYYERKKMRSLLNRLYELCDCKKILIDVKNMVYNDKPEYTGPRIKVLDILCCKATFNSVLE